MEENRKIVVITDLRSEEACLAAEYLKTQGYDVRTVPEDILLWKEEPLRKWAEPFCGNLAGVIHPAPPIVPGGIEEFTEEQWSMCADQGPVAALIVTKVFGMLMREQGGGAIIYLNSIHAEKPLGKGYLYSMGCGAVQMLCRDFTQDYGVYGIRPYFVMRGPSEADAFAKNDLTALYYGMDMRYPQRKMPEPGYLNGILAFLLTDAATPLMGSDVRAENGFTGFYFSHTRRVEGRRYLGDE